MSNKSEPKLFISYSWSSPDHEAFVLGLAEEMASQGIHVILDKWDLQPGHDANAFMESMVTDPAVTKVVLVCDQKYAIKSNSRSGGAGAEAQIITPELYAKKAQDKFVAVIAERDCDGRPYLPVYYGSRIYIDFTDPSIYAAEFDKLVRWAWDQPLHVRPEKGAKPGFLTSGGAPAKIATAVPFRRASDAIRSNSANASAFVEEYLSTLANGMEAYRVKVGVPGVEPDDIIKGSIDELLLYKNEAVELFSAIAQYACGEEMLLRIHRFFERLLPYTERSENTVSYNEVDFDNFRFLAHELFLSLLSVFLRFEKFDAFSYMLDNEYFWENTNNRKEKMHPYMHFWHHVKTLEYRNQRLKLNRASVQADMLQERSKASGVDFRFMMAADFILYFRSRNMDVWNMWFPVTLVYVGKYGGAFEVFARAKSLRYFDRIKRVLKVDSKAELAGVLEKMRNEPDRIPRGQYGGVNIERLISFDMLATTP